MKLIAGIIGINKWQEFTYPAFKSVSNWCKTVIIDNGSEPPYRFGKRIERTSYAGAINYFLKSFDSEWYLVLNNDILCNGPIHVNLDPMKLYGKKIRSQEGVEWIDTWCLLISKKVFELVGEFDENFKMVGFEDADYCIRAKALGIPVALAPLPLVHLADSSRWDLPDYEKQRQANIDLLKQKHGVILDSSAEVIT